MEEAGFYTYSLLGSFETNKTQIIHNIKQLRVLESVQAVICNSEIKKLGRQKGTSHLIEQIFFLVPPYC